MFGARFSKRGLSLHEIIQKKTGFGLLWPLNSIIIIEEENHVLNNVPIFKKLNLQLEVFFSFLTALRHPFRPVKKLASYFLAS